MKYGGRSRTKILGGLWNLLLKIWNLSRGQGESMKHPWGGVTFSLSGVLWLGGAAWMRGQHPWGMFFQLGVIISGVVKLSLEQRVWIGLLHTDFLVGVKTVGDGTKTLTMMWQVGTHEVGNCRGGNEEAMLQRSCWTQLWMWCKHIRWQKKWKSIPCIPLQLQTKERWTKFGQVSIFEVAGNLLGVNCQPFVPLLESATNLNTEDKGLTQCRTSCTFQSCFNIHHCLWSMTKTAEYLDVSTQHTPLFVTLLLLSVCFVCRRHYPWMSVKSVNVLWTQHLMICFSLERQQLGNKHFATLLNAAETEWKLSTPKRKLPHKGLCETSQLGSCETSRNRVLSEKEE